MDSINSWINEEEVRKLAEDLTGELKVTSAQDVSVKPRESMEENKSDGFADLAKQNNRSIEEILKEEANVVSSDGSVRIPNEVKAEKALSLANASAMAASVGLINSNKPAESDVKPQESSVGITKKAAEATPLCDNYLNAVPVNIDPRKKSPISIPEVHTEKGLGTFGEIDKQLTESVKTNGICVIDRDGDVLYSSFENKHLVRFSVDTVMKSKLLRTEEGEVGNVRLKLSSDNFIEFVSVKSTRGVIVLSATMKDGLGSQKAKQVADDMLKIANMA